MSNADTKPIGKAETDVDLRKIEAVFHRALTQFLADGEVPVRVAPSGSGDNTVADGGEAGVVVLKSSVEREATLGRSASAGSNGNSHISGKARSGL